MAVRKYSSRSQKTTLASAITSSSASITVVSAVALMGGKTLTAGQRFTVVIDPDTALEEIVQVYSSSANPVSGNTLAIARAIDGSIAQAHSAGAEVRHMAIGEDYQEANDHANNVTSVHGLTIANVLETTDTDMITTAMLQANAVTTAKITDANITTAKIADANVTTAKIADLNVTTGKIADSAITSGKIADGTIVNADINTSAQIAYGKLALTNGIVNGDINASAAIDWSKIAPSSTVSATELGYLDGVTSAVQTQLDSKLSTSTASSTYAPLASPALTGTPTAPTATAGTNTTQVATTAYVGTAINNLIAGAPTTLDTLDEIAAALADTANFSDTVVLKSGSTMSGALAMGTNKITGLGDPTNAQDAVTKYYLDNVVLAPSNLTGPITSVGSATSIASQTGTGTKFVMDNTPTLITPVLGVATATSINGTTIPSSKTLVATDSTAYVVPSQTGNSGKYLTTDGTTSSWASVTTDPTADIFMMMGA